MRIVLATGGSRGDVQPYLALGSELRRREHEVVVLTYGAYEGMVDALGLSFAELSGDPQEIVENLTEAGHDVLRFARRFRRVTEHMIERNFEQTLEACRGADAVVHASVAFLGFFAARDLRIPAIMAEMQPIFEPTKSFPSAVMPEGPWPFQGLYNRMSYSVVRQIYWRTFRPMLQRIAGMRADLERVPALRGPFDSLRRLGVPVLCGWSRRVLPRPLDWDTRMHVTGYWFVDRTPHWTPPADLRDFLREEGPTVAVGFSSVRSIGDVRPTLDRVLRALDQSRMRAVFVRGWSEVETSGLPPSVFVIEEAPHDWLFPRVSAVIHHGGAGTTAAALRAGVPSMVLPFSADQKFWGRTVERLGAGIAGAAGRGGSSPDLTRMLVEAGGARLQAGAAMIGCEIRAERGVARAAAIVEENVSGRREV